MLPQVKASTYTGTGSAVTVTLGFKPNYIVIWNETDGDVRWEYISGLADEYAYQILDSGSGTTDLSAISSNGITVSATGFVAGTSLSESSKVFRYFAIGGYDPQ